MSKVVTVQIISNWERSTETANVRVVSPTDNIVTFYKKNLSKVTLESDRAFLHDLGSMAGNVKMEIHHMVLFLKLSKL